MANQKESYPAHSTTSYEEWMSESPTDGLLEGGGESSILGARHHGSKWTRLIKLYLILIHVSLIALILASIPQAYLPWNANHGIVQDDSTWSPIQQFVEYEVKSRDSHGHDKVQKYDGPPTVDKDRAWDRLIKPAYFNATFEDLERAGESLDNVTQLTGGGYLASIGVYHELHCVRQLRFYIYKDRYYPNISKTEDRYLRIHLDHCIEALRETIMCSGNTALISFYWDKPTATQPAAQSNARSQCAQWDSIERWGHSRMVSTNPDFILPR